jgi:nitroreductase
MNATLELLTVRRSAKLADLCGPGPGASDIDALLKIASRTPDHGKLAPWRFIVFEGDGCVRAGEIIAEVYAKRHAEADAARLDAERLRLRHAPLVVAVVSRAAPHAKIPEWEQILSAGAVCMNLVVAANALGFASAWLTGWHAYEPEVLTRLGLDAHEKIAGFVHIGQCAAPREDRDRPALADIVTWF